MEKGNRKVRIGRVVSDKMDKTRVAAVVRMTRHPLCKIIRRTKNISFTMSAMNPGWRQG